MTPQKQANRHDPTNGIYGDCYRTVIACLLDLPRDEVPHVHEDTGALNMGDQTERMRAWLAERGLTELSTAFNGELADVLTTVGHYNPGVHYMLTGQSRTGCNHVVICYGNEIVWDTSLNDSGIIGPADDGFYWVSWIGKRV